MVAHDVKDLSLEVYDREYFVDFSCELFKDEVIGAKCLCGNECTE